jgi:putative endonuclease
MYVVKCADGSFYAGITTDITRRLHEHNSTNRGAKYTRPRRPVKLVYSTDHDDRSSASIAEAVFKKLTRKQKESLIS